MFELADFYTDALPDTTSKGFVTPPRIKLGHFCLLGRFVNLYNMGRPENAFIVYNNILYLFVCSFAWFKF